MKDQKKKDTAWYPLRIAYGRERRVKVLLDSHGGIETFLPMRPTSRGKENHETVQIPAVRGLLFVRASVGELDALRTESLAGCPFHYYLDRETRRPLTVPDEAMARFRRVCEGREEVEYVDAARARLKKGVRVRVTGGPWAGLEGELIHIRGGRRVMISIPGLFSVVTASVSPTLLEIIAP